ncbi:type II toxin-antitoxin system VapC family toxin [Acidiphilium multivorum]|nr:type II toxin-antitoxin system VapC family toxin [Acidiphilium multivorum]MBS3025583.1 type II toxin-antitoxin system VapC family toxin [Acidiphilium multivorum]
MRSPKVNESAVLDSSAVLALLFGEPGAERVKETLPGALLSAVNFAEIVTKLCERGMPQDQARLAIEAIGVEVVDFGIDQACVTGELRNRTRSAGLSLGDRACLALAQQQNLPAVTADTAWAQIPEVNVVIIR